MKAVSHLTQQSVQDPNIHIYFDNITSIKLPFNSAEKYTLSHSMACRTFAAVADEIQCSLTTEVQVEQSTNRGM